ncbi:MAG: ATP-grasp domain-containing protein [Steroidobacteraceae bacterium]
MADLAANAPHFVVFPMTDVTVPLVVDMIDSGTRLRSALPGRAQYLHAVDKYYTAEAARGAGIGSPQTFVVSMRNLTACDEGGLSFPVVVKPRRSAQASGGQIFRRSVSYCRDAETLQTTAKSTLLDENDEVLVQELVVGQGCGVFALYDHGQALGFFAHERLREKPPSGGVSVLSRSVPVPSELRSRVERLLGGMQWHGVAMVEFKRDQSGEYWLMEINARLWGSLQLAIDCGVEFPWYMYQLAVGQPVSFPHCYSIGRYLRWWLGDLDHLYLTFRDADASIKKKLTTLGRFLMPWRPGLRYELLRLSDPRPAAFAARDYLRALLR